MRRYNTDGKDFKQLCWADKRIKRLFQPIMKDCVRCKIELICGFELFNTREYHNLETWSQGYKITAYNSKEEEIAIATAEDLDIALSKLEKMLEELRIESSHTLTGDDAKRFVEHLDSEPTETQLNTYKKAMSFYKEHKL